MAEATSIFPRLKSAYEYSVFASSSHLTLFHQKDLAFLRTQSRFIEATRSLGTAQERLNAVDVGQELIRENSRRVALNEAQSSRDGTPRREIARSRRHISRRL